MFSKTSQLNSLQQFNSASTVEQLQDPSHITAFVVHITFTCVVHSSLTLYTMIAFRIWSPLLSPTSLYCIRDTFPT